jgi:tRNA dimethylallyltransferase
MPRTVSAVSFPTSGGDAERGSDPPVTVGALLVVGGTTASGKSALAAALAARLDAVIVNADSQQLFADLPILTARPTPAEEARLPHRLYGLLGPAEQPSAGRWLGMVVPLLERLGRDRRLAVLVGGSGLYLHALLHGLASIPPVPAELRARLQEASRELPSAALHARLAARDPLTAARLRPSDRQRILRALEVLEATGRPLAAWQAGPRRPPVRPAALLGVALLPPAAVTGPRIERRLSAQLAAGALAEVAELAGREPRLASLPIARVHGCRELLAVHEGRLEPALAAARIAAQVRGYAKRQRTWFRHQLPELEPLAETGEEVAERGILAERVARLLGRAGV